MRLKNPPIIEAWIEFHLRSSDQEATWPLRLREFLQEAHADFPHIERQVEEHFQILKRKPSGEPLEGLFEGKLRRVRAFDEARQRCVQVAKDMLVFNLIRRDQDYGGFDRLLNSSLEQLERYTRVFRPAAVHSAAIHYVDLVRIPADRVHGDFRLEDYFTFDVKLPDPDRPVRLSFDLETPARSKAGESETLKIVFRTEPRDSQNGDYRFRLDWHAHCGELDTLDVSVLKERLSRIHEGLRDLFKESFRRTTWDLFEEEE